jgi:predicted RNA-binding protein with RPS1 domain
MSNENAQPVIEPVKAAKPCRPKSKPSRAPRHDKRWDEVAQLVASGATVSVVVTDIATNKEGQRRGLSVKLQGLRGFLPGSEVTRGANFDELKGKTVQVKVLESDPKARGGRLIVSMKAIADGERNQFIQGLEIGSEVTGKVVSVVDFGYFVNIGALDGLLHVTQTPLENGKPKVFSVGNTVTVRVKAVDLEAGKVSLTMRQPRRSDEFAARGREGGTQQYPSRNTARFARKPSVSIPGAVTVTAAKVVTPGKPRKLRATRKSPFTHSFSSFADLAAWLAEDRKHDAGENTSFDAPVPAAERA